MDELALNLALLRDAEHVAADVAAHPCVALLLKNFAAQPGAAADVEQQARRVLRQAEHLDGALGHAGLHLDHAARVQVLVCLRFIVENVCRPALLGSRTNLCGHW